MLELYRRAYGEARALDRAEVLRWLASPEIRSDWLRVLEVDGRLVGYGDIEINQDRVQLEVAAPSHWNRYLDWAEEVARTHDVDQVALLSYAGEELAAAASARGFRLWRSHYTMRVELGDEPPPASEPPPEIEFASYREGDADALRAAMDVAFADDPLHRSATPDHFRDFYLGGSGFDPSLWTLAWDGAGLTGFALAFSERPGDAATGEVKLLGVLPGWRRQGLGAALLRQAFRRLHARGLRAVELGVDGANETGAIRLYQRAGMRVLHQADDWLLEL